MSWMEFIARLSDAWAWPLVAGWSIFLLRRQIRSAADGLIQRIGEIARLVFPGGSIDFRKGVEELAQATGELTSEQPKAVAPAEPVDAVLPRETTDELLTKYQQLAVLDPRAAILSTFADLESAIRRRFRQLYPQERPTVGFGRILNVLHTDGLLDDDVAGTLRNIYSLRNEAAHEGTRLDVDVANSFVDSVGSMLGYLILSDFFGTADKLLP